MNNLSENLQNLNWVRVIVVLVIAFVVQYFMRKRTDKMEKRLFGDDLDRYRANKDGVSPFDRPPVGFDAEKAAKEAEQLEKAKQGSTHTRTVKELKRRSSASGESKGTDGTNRAGESKPADVKPSGEKNKPDDAKTEDAGKDRSNG